ncbi:hypothetical protein QCB45_04310 [Thiomicrorhabdus sp. ZW0627]|uniref:hypothetical protein n=1 Tax=Thiomicrorhabdus sp. ZW0627 TaxID=3039774 RepID=UPI002436B503|nr:hypothetical protein [Thiomicrorhabdus sp. ZW0627]MDG6773546.1 hypothetical protein [Thiomicrorhabdus sp. ZW0627]
MSCCSGGYCQFKFPEGPPLVDNPVANMNATYQFLPYGTLLEEGEVVRIWMESGKAKTVIIEEKVPLTFTSDGPVSDNGNEVFPWQLVALDSGIAYDELMGWINHPLYNPGEKSVLLKYRHPIEVKPSLKMTLLKWLYKLRNL